jgi:hypothetical protein
MLCLLYASMTLALSGGLYSSLLNSVVTVLQTIGFAKVAGVSQADAALVLDEQGYWQWWRLLYLVAFVPFMRHVRAVKRLQDAALFDGMMRPYSLCVVALSLMFALCVGL